MTDPKDQLPLDAQENDADDQQSQQDIHSDGIEGTDELIGEQEPDVNGLKAAGEASEAAFTLDVDKGLAPKKM